MAEKLEAGARPTDPVGRVLYAVALFVAIVGGILSGAMGLLVTISVIGRYLFNAPIQGDYDIVAIAIGTSVFCFLPLCQLLRGNVVVDFFTAGASPRTKSILDAIGNLVYLIIASMLAWRMIFLMLELRQYQDVIAAFTFYRWSTVPIDIVCMVVLIVVILYTLVCDIGDIKAGRVAARTDVHGE